MHLVLEQLYIGTPHRHQVHEPTYMYNFMTRSFTAVSNTAMTDYCKVKCSKVACVLVLVKVSRIGTTSANRPEGQHADIAYQ